MGTQENLQAFSEKEKDILAFISNGNRTERSPIRSVIIRVITKSDVLLPINHKNYNFREKEYQGMKKRENLH